MADEEDSGPKIDPGAQPKRYDFDPKDVGEVSGKGILSKEKRKKKTPAKRSYD